jgi:hypothetical protein
VVLDGDQVVDDVVSWCVRSSHHDSKLIFGQRSVSVLPDDVQSKPLPLVWHLAEPSNV